MVMHNGYEKSDSQEFAGITSSEVDIDQLQQVIDKAAETLRECPEDASSTDLNETINEALELLQKYSGQ